MNDYNTKGYWARSPNHIFPDNRECDFIKCSQCGEEALLDEYGKYYLSPYCPFCGQPMSEEVFICKIQ